MTGPQDPHPDPSGQGGGPAWEQPPGGYPQAGDQAPGGPYGSAPQPGEPYGGGYAPGQQYPGPQYGGQPYFGQQYPGQPHPGQQYGAGYHPGQQYPGPPYGYQGGYEPSPPPASNRKGLLIGVAVGAVVLLLLAVGAVSAFVWPGFLAEDTDDQAAAPPSAPASAPPVPSAPSGPELPDRTPTLRDVAPLSVIGPTWKPGDDTYTMEFRGFPFAFRVAADWECVRGSHARFPEAVAWTCVDSAAPAPGFRVDMILRPCTGGCGAAQRKSLTETWLDEPEKAKTFDERTSYVETRTNEEGRYQVDFSRFVADSPGGPLAWQVGVFVESPQRTKDVVLKTLNDIVTQTR